MQMGWQRVRQPVKRKSRLVRHDAGPFGPEPGSDQPLLLARGEMHEPVDPTAHPNDTSAVDVVHEQLRGVPRLGRLFGREHALLTDRHVEEAVPVGAVYGSLCHTRNVSHTLVLCKTGLLSAQL